MGKSKEKKFEKMCTMTEAAGILRAIASALEGGNAPETVEQGLDLKGCSKLKLSLKKKGDAVCMKYKAKAEDKVYVKASVMAEADGDTDEAGAVEESAPTRSKPAPGFSAEAAAPAFENKELAGVRKQLVKYIKINGKQPNRGAFVELICDELGTTRSNAIALIDEGEGTLWECRHGSNNAKLYVPIGK